jgi:dUTPase
MIVKRKKMFKVLDKVCQPTKGSKHSAGIDLYAREDVVIGAGETKVVPLGVKIDADYFYQIVEHFAEYNDKYGERHYQHSKVEERINYFKSEHHLELFNRSSTALKRGLILANGTGIIDLDYDEEIGAILHYPVNLKGVVDINDLTYADDLCLTKDVEIKKGDKICQIILKENKSYLMGVESDEERSGGFGSTGS